MKANPPNQINADKMQRNPPRKDYKELMKPMLDITCKTTSWVVGKHKTNADKQHEIYKENMEETRRAMHTNWEEKAAFLASLKCEIPVVHTLLPLYFCFLLDNPIMGKIDCAAY